MENVLNVYKPIGLTPLQLIKTVQIKHPKLVEKKIAFAGRLDPMAEGVMVLLIEPETKNRSHYQDLDKKYTFSMILGIQTDTHDLLGEIIKTSKTRVSVKKITQIISSHKGTHEQYYPAYSSKTVDGKPLYWWARRNKLDTIDIPSKIINIRNISTVKIREIQPLSLYKNIVRKVNLVQGDFRQNAILEGWKQYLNKQTADLQEVKVSMSCSSGTYVRSLVDTIGSELGSYAVTSSIKRTRVGEYTSENSLRIT